MNRFRNPTSRVSAVLLENPGYPDGDYGFSPDEPFPELLCRAQSPRPNLVYRGVRQCLADAGLDSERFGTPEWNPLSEFVGQGGRVFVLCNFVSHRIPGETREAFQGKCTHASVLRPVIDYALKAVGERGRVEFGNAPIQSCRWQDVLHETGADQLSAFYESNAPGRVAPCDLRGHVVVRGRLGAQRPPERRIADIVELDLGAESSLEGQEGNRLYRVAQYDPRETMAYHQGGSHVYALHDRIARADLVISVPKLKTHEKVGVTGALKGCVGAAALKQCLAHHSKGLPGQGGDEYPRFRVSNALLSGLGDWVWTRPEGPLTNAGRVVETVLAAAIRRTGGVTGGAWPGNDTCWRMALDIARCVAYVGPNGWRPIGEARPHLVLTDGVIGGEGEGPLKPCPVRSGWLAFATNPLAGDHVNCIAMGYDSASIPLVRNAAELTAWPVASPSSSEIRVTLNGTEVGTAELRARMNRIFRPPSAWRGVIEHRP